MNLDNKSLVDNADLEGMARAWERGDDAGLVWLLAKYTEVRVSYVNIWFRFAAWFFFILWLFTVGAWAFILQVR